MNIKNELIKFSDRTTVHGITNIVHARSTTIRLLWIICFSIAIFFCIFIIKQNLDDYYSFKVISKLENINIKQNEYPINHPMITICNLEICGFDNYDYKTYINKLKKNNRADQEKYIAAQSNVINEKLRKVNTKRNLISLGQETFLKYYDQKKLDLIFSRKNSTNKLLKPFLISCMINNRQNCENKYEIFRLGSYRDCYQFKLNWTDLKFEFYLGNENECKSPFSASSGLSVYIHSPTFTLTEDVSNNILVEPGTHSSIGLTVTKIKKLSKPFSDCFDDNKVNRDTNTLVGKTISLIGNYEQDYCLELCHQYYLIDYCNCYQNILTNFKPNNLKLCPKLIDSLYSCEFLINEIFYNNKNDADCLKKCPKECEFFNYEPNVISKSKYPSNEYFDFLKILKLNKTSNKSRLISLNIYIGVSSFNKITESQSYGRSRLLGDIGGTMGLFIGISFISFAEIVELFCITFFPIFRKFSIQIKKLFSQIKREFCYK
jgi:hypothetical protein